MNMNFKPMNKVKYEPNLHEYEYEYRCQFMNHDKSHELYEPTPSFFEKIESSALKKI